jgi:very-short-patch-repair endonuclease
MKRKIIPYNPKLKILARQLRQNMTYSEVKLWNKLRNAGMMGYDFDRQKPIGNFIVDFYCKDPFLAIEIDGITHHDKIVMNKDDIRQKELELIGVSFLRFNALQVVRDMPNVMRAIENWIFDYEDKHGVLKHVLKKRTTR